MAGETHHLTTIDPLSLCVTPVTMLFNDTVLSDATGFFFYGVVESKPTLWLVSNWHVFSGRHIEPPNAALAKTGSIPNRVKFQVLKLLPNSVAEVWEQFADLYEKDGRAIWFQHPLKSEIDIGVLNCGDLLSEFAVNGIKAKANQYSMKIEIGDDVFVLGYPLGFTHFMSTPIWKRGTIASEPHWETPSSKHRIVIDATTRAGMSGSPVVLRQKTHYVSMTGEVVKHVNASRILGVYSSRPNFKGALPSLIDDMHDQRSELGYVYKSGLIEQVIKDGGRGPDYGVLP